MRVGAKYQYCPWCHQRMTVDPPRPISEVVLSDFRAIRLYYGFYARLIGLGIVAFAGGFASAYFHWPVG